MLTSWTDEIFGLQDRCFNYVVGESIAFPVTISPHLPSSSLSKSFCYEFHIGMPGLSQWGLAVRLNLSTEASLVSLTHLLGTLKPSFYSNPIGQCEEWESCKRLGMRNKNKDNTEGLGKKRSGHNVEFVIFSFVSCFLFLTQFIPSLRHWLWGKKPILW